MKEKENRSMAAYDWVIPSDKLDPDASAAEIIRHLAEKSELSFSKDELQPALNDFVKAARVAFVLARKGYDVPVRAKQGRVTLTVNKHVILLSSLKQKLKKIALDVNGVDDVKVEVGRRYYRANICHGYHYRISSADIRANYAQKYAELYQSAELRCGRQIQLTSGR